MTSQTLRFSLVLALFMVTASAKVSADPLTREAVRAELSGFEHAPLAATVHAWGAQGALFLTELANDTAEAPFLRARAVTALRGFAPDPGIHRFITEILASSAHILVRRAAMEALALSFHELSLVGAMLGANLVDLRDGAAWTLAAVNSPASRAMLQARLRVEPDENVRRTITLALANPPAENHPFAATHRPLPLPSAPRRRSF